MMYHEFQLLDAARDGDFDRVRMMLEVEQDLNLHRAGHHGNTVLHFAAKYGQLDIIQLCLKKGVPIDIRNGNDHTPLFEAMHSNMETIKFLIAHGADIYDLIPKGKQTVYSRLIEYAAYVGNLEAIKFLIDKGISLEASEDGTNLLMLAAFNESPETIKFLLTLFDVNAVNQGGASALHIAAITPCAGNNLKTLLEAGADYTLEYKSGRTKGKTLLTVANERVRKIIEAFITQKEQKELDGLAEQKIEEITTL